MDMTSTTDDHHIFHNAAIESYKYLYPLVLMDITRKVHCNRIPMNKIAHRREIIPPSFRTVVKPNFDTLYSGAWLDVSSEPMIVSTPNTESRYYVLAFHDMYSEVFASPGKRSSGTHCLSRMERYFT